VSRQALVWVVVGAMLVSGCTSQLQETFGSSASNDWALEMTQVDELHDRNLTGASVRLAVVDSGVGADHREYEGVTVRWKDVVNEQPNPYDDDGHGTHVSGLAVAQGKGGFNNPKVQGVAPGSPLLHAKAIEASGSSSASDVAQGIDWAVDNGADVLVLSLGERPRVVDINRNLENSVSRALDRGVVVVAAAGNAQQGESGEDCQVSSPANLEDVIAVGAVDRNGTIAEFSCKGGSSSGPLGIGQREDPNKKPELSAPGVGLIGPWPGLSCAGRADAKYCLNSGTSQAAPIVGGIVALMLEENPDLQRQDRETITQIKTSLTETAEKQSFRGHNDRYGYGIVQGADALDHLNRNT
jgi:serine protease AprX